MLLVSPGSIQWIFGTACPHILSGMIGSLFLAFALVSSLGLKDPIKFIPLLLMQLLYKSVWLCFVAFPLLIANEISNEIIPVIAVFLIVVIGDAIAIPFRFLFRNSQNKSKISGAVTPVIKCIQFLILQIRWIWIASLFAFLPDGDLIFSFSRGP